MRAVILILIVAILAIIAAVAHRLPRHQPDPRRQGARRSARPRNGVTAKGGQAPAFDVETGSVKVGTKETTVKVPALEVQNAGQNQAGAGDQQRACDLRRRPLG